jgi:hypothetical protein
VAAVPAKPKFDIPVEDYGDWLGALLTHPTAVFIEEIKVAPSQPAAKAETIKPPVLLPLGKHPAEKEPEVSASPEMEIRAGMVVSLGPDSTRFFVKFLQYITKAKKAGADGAFEQIQINGETWYRYTPPKPGDKNRVTFGFHGKYFVVGVGDKAVEGILARWNSPAPAWLTKAQAQTPVPRRTGIIYLNLKALREKLLPLAPSQKDAVAVLEVLGLNNVDSLISTTGLEDDGMINRVLLATDGGPRGLLDMIADRPLAAKDLEPIPSDAMLALAARLDLERMFKLFVLAYGKAGVDADVQKALEKLAQEYGVDVRRLLSSVGDTWCLYNSPSEGQLIFFGWTAVVSVRDRAALIDSWEKLCAAKEKSKAAQKNSAKDQNQGDIQDSGNESLEFRKCRFAGQEIYYMAGQPLAPVFCITDHEMVMTLSMPAMKAYLVRKNHCSLATLPGVTLALNDPNGPAALGYCDTPRVFELLYPLVSTYAGYGLTAFGAQSAKNDLDPTFWPSSAAIRPHLRPDVTTLRRSPQGLELTCRYCLPSGGVNAPLGVIVLGTLETFFGHGLPLPYSPVPYTGDAVPCVPAPEYAPAPGQTVPPTLPAATTPAATIPAPAPGGYTTPGFAAPASPPTVSPPKPAPGSPATPYSTPVASPYGSTPAGGYGAGAAPPAYGYSSPAPGYASPPANPNSTVAPPFRTPGYAAPAPAAGSSQPLAPSGVGASPLAEAPKHKLTIADVIALTRADVDEALIINHIRSHGLAAPLQPGDAVNLKQQGVSRKVIETMQQQPVPTVIPKPAPGPGNSSTAPDSNRRAQEAIYTSENLRLLQDEWERFWLLDQPDHMTPYRTHGGLL